MSLLKRIERLEQEVQGKKIPPLFISPFNKDEILGFRNGDDAVMRMEGEDIKHLESRALETLQKGSGAILLTAITASWGNWPYMPQPTEDEWCKEVKEYYQQSNEEEK